MNKVVARFQDGRTMKGRTNDFIATKDRFFLVLEDGKPGAKPVEVRVEELKALFFVKELAGNPDHKKTNHFDPSKPVPGRKVRVVFKDGETLEGVTQGYQPNRPGFFLVPADRHSNNERCFVITASTKEVALI